MPDSEHVPENHWWHACSKRVDELWVWMHSHDAEITAWWKEQWRCNKTLEDTLADHESRMRSLEAMSAKVGLAAVMGAMLGAGVVTWLVGKF